MAFSGKGPLHLAYGFISVVFRENKIKKKLDTFGIVSALNIP